MGIVVRSVQNPTMQSAYNWGNIKITGNNIINYRQAVFISNLPHKKDGSLANAENIVISDNRIEYMWNGNNEAAIHFVGSQYQQCEVSNNTITGGKFGVWPGAGDTDWLLVEGNVLN